ncbi:MAG: nucleoside hydrolase [Proteobacteria bacterium]|nr:nucleoside hydrolase [Pseudomonadota bacterium]
MSHVVIFDNDGSSDDITALIYLASDPNVTIKGITMAATGEAHGLLGAKNMAAFCFQLGIGGIPIAYGTEKPISKSFLPFPDYLRQIIDNILEGKSIKEHPNPIITDNAVELIRTIVQESNDKVTILATGPLTNIAQFIDQYPALTNKIEKIVIMGGAIKAEGNIQALHKESTNKVAECNILADPEAAQRVFSSKIPVVLVPLDATNQVPMTEAFYLSLGLSQNPDHHLIYLLLKDIWDGFGREIFVNHFYLWDPLAAMICTQPAIAEYESMPLVVDLESGQTRVDVSNESSCHIQVATKILEPKTILSRLMEKITERIEPKTDLIVSLLDKNAAYTPGHDKQNNEEAVKVVELEVNEQTKYSDNASKKKVTLT